MNPVVKNAVTKAFPKLSLYARVIKHLVKNEGSYLQTTGWMRSLIEQKPVDKDGREVPWMNYPVIAFLSDRLKTDLHLFEFGSGYSTLFYARQVHSVTSVEYDEAWVKLIRLNLPNNVNLMYQEKDVDGKYCRVIGSTGKKYDVVVIDGRDRVNCIKQSIGALSDRGIILLDDSQREGYIDGINHAKRNGFSALSFEGLKPTGNETEHTTIFYRRNNCFDI